MKPLLHYANKIFLIVKMSKTTNAVNQILFDKKNDTKNKADCHKLLAPGNQRLTDRWTNQPLLTHNY